MSEGDGEGGDGEADDGPDDDAAYERIRAQLAEHFGWSFDVIDAMPFDCIESACRMGRVRKGVRVKSAEDARSLRRNWRRQLGL